jgi:hypothetical protein
LYRFAMGLVAASLLALSPNASAFSVDSNLFYLSDSLSETSNTTSSRIFGDIAVFIDLTKKGRWIVGWGYNYFSITESGTTESTFNLTEMGPKFGYYISKDKVWSIIVGYCFQSTADYSSGSTEAEWRGTSLKGELGFMPKFGESFHAGLKLNYYQATFSEQFTNSTDFDTISNSRALIYPTISFSYMIN